MNWSEGIKAFKSYLLLERGLSENTVVNYVYDVHKLVKYFENNNMANETNHQEIESKDQEEYTPKLFSEEHDFEPDHDKDETNREAESSTDFEPDQLFEHDLNEEDDFEIPAFLRKQKF